MRTKQRMQVAGVAAAGLAVALLAGCRVESGTNTETATM